MFDARKHYFVGRDEVEKLLAKGGGWLARHPAKDEIARRYLGNRPSLYKLALSRLVGDEEPDEDETPEAERGEERLERPISPNDQRLGSVVAALRATGAKRVLDLGCGEGKLIRELLKDRQFEEIVGVGVSVRSLEVAARRPKLERLPDAQANRVKLVHGSLMYRDTRRSALLTGGAFTTDVPGASSNHCGAISRPVSQSTQVESTKKSPGRSPAHASGGSTGPVLPSPISTPEPLPPGGSPRFPRPPGGDTSPTGLAIEGR